MIGVLWISGFLFLAGFIVVVGLMQRVYLESMRLRLKESAFLDHFKDDLEDRLGARVDDGATAFALAKHGALVLLTCGVTVFTFTGDDSFWIAAAEGLGTSLVLAFTSLYLLPPLLFQRTEGRWLLPFVPLLMAVMWLMRPVQFFLNFLESLALIGQPLAESDEAQNQDEHLEAFMEAGEEEGIIEEEDRKLIRSVVEFGDKTVREVMTARNAMVVVQADRTLAELRQLVIEAQYSRFPVYEDDLDQIIGFVHVRDMFEVGDSDLDKRTVRELIRPIRAVPESKPVSRLLKELQAESTHMAIVVNEYGNTAGLVTLEDVMEEIFGEIRDEHEPEHDIESDGNGGFIVPGSLDLDRLDEIIGYRPEPEPESTTVGGLIAEWAGHVPRVGEVVEEDGILMEVLAGNELRVDKVRVCRKETETLHG